MIFKNIDLTGIKKLTYRYSSKRHDARIEVHVNSVNGPLISTLDYKTTGSWDIYKEVSVPIQDPGGINDLYFVFKKDDEPNKHLCSLDWINFDN